MFRIFAFMAAIKSFKSPRLSFDIRHGAESALQTCSVHYPSEISKMIEFWCLHSQWNDMKLDSLRNVGQTKRDGFDLFQFEDWTEYQPKHTWKYGNSNDLNAGFSNKNNTKAPKAKIFFILSKSQISENSEFQIESNFDFCFKVNY